MHEIKFWGEKLKIINELKKENDYLRLSKEQQDEMLKELITM